MSGVPSQRAHEEALLNELAMLTDLVIAASSSPGGLSTGQVDDVLGVAPSDDDEPDDADSHDGDSAPGFPGPRPSS